MKKPIKMLHKAKKEKNDEFHTKLEDIEKELQYYTDCFNDKLVYCNCDDYRNSNFFEYFKKNFDNLKIKKLISSCYIKDGNGIVTMYDGNNTKVIKLKGDGDFRSEECIKILEKCDVVVTNPPFSLFREYIEKLMEYNKKFLIIGSQNAITYKNIYELIKLNKIFLGHNNGDMEFKVPDYYEEKATRFRQDENGQKWRSLGNICWFTNIETGKKDKKIPLIKKYNPEEYPKYDNYDAINVDKVKDIPYDYKGVIGVPLTFLYKYNPEQFEIIDFRKGKDGKDLSVNGKTLYFRVLIKPK
jgi:hypothetical protein